MFFSICLFRFGCHGMWNLSIASRIFAPSQGKYPRPAPSAVLAVRSLNHWTSSKSKALTFFNPDFNMAQLNRLSRTVGTLHVTSCHLCAEHPREVTRSADGPTFCGLWSPEQGPPSWTGPPRAHLDVGAVCSQARRAVHSAQVFSLRTDSAEVQPLAACISYAFCVRPCHLSNFLVLAFCFFLLFLPL